MHVTGAWILLIFIVTVTVTMLLLLHLTRLGLILHDSMPDRPHRRNFLASISFFITFLAVRLLVASIQHHIGPFQYVSMGGRHIHHLVWGILILLGVGYGYTQRSRRKGHSLFHFRRPPHGNFVRSRRGAHARRVRALAQPRRRVLVARRA